MTSTVQDLIRRFDEELINHPDVQAAIAELEGLIRGRYPDAQFVAGVGFDPLGIYLDAYVDVEDTEEVDDLFGDRLLELQVEDRIPIHVITLNPRYRWVQDGPAPETVAACASG